MKKFDDIVSPWSDKDIDYSSRRQPGGYTKNHANPPFLKNSSSQRTPLSINNILSGKEIKMSQSFSNNINSLNNYTAVSVSNNFTFADGRSSILDWLSPLDPKLQHQDIGDCRVEGVGEWLLQTEEFRSWCSGNGGGESDNAVLFSYEDPGAGKTFIR